MVHQVSVQLGSQTLTIETGKLAKQAGGAAYVRFGDSVVLVTATAFLAAGTYNPFIYFRF